jgi:hypothetical protein
LTFFFNLLIFQLALAILGFYASLITIATLWPSSKKPALVTSVSAETIAVDDANPSIDSADFGEWLSKEGSFEKLFV